MRLAAALLMLAVAAAVATTLAPTQHNFGRVAVGASSNYQNFTVTLPAGSQLTDSIAVSVGGADPQDYALTKGPGRIECSTAGNIGPVAGGCIIGVGFWPRSLGPKTARLQVVDSRGTTVTANLSGIGVQPVCEMKVVFCNYAHLFSGSFSWQSDLNGRYGQNRRSVNVNVINGKAACDGSETDVNIDGQGFRTTQVGTILGDGLIAIEFEQDSAGRNVYRITAACPSPSWPATPDQGARAPEPAELGNSYYEYSDPRLIPASQPIPPAALRGGRRGAHPDVDALNGVTGTMSVSWAFTRS